MEALIEGMRGIVDAENPQQRLEEILAAAERLFPLRDSAKHMNGRDLGRLEPTPDHRPEPQTFPPARRVPPDHRFTNSVVLLHNITW
ncbi:MAG: hypothetical protein EA420_19630 [Candidatus Competibacteraceae bacterium]|nr:MAG: hypothetical protein EA420_19630 [Candidatus Competibacteraceae bacterium]